MTCDTGENRLGPVGGRCPCKEGYYDLGNGECGECHNSCKTCSGSGPHKCI